MGGKHSSGTSSTTPTIPPWLQGLIQPMLQGSVQKMITLQNQGWNVLQGNPEDNSSVTLEDLQNQVPAPGQRSAEQAAAAAALPGGKSPYQR